MKQSTEKQLLDKLDRLDTLVSGLMEKLEKPGSLVYNVTEAAEALGISTRSMYELMNQAGFPASLRVGNRRLISRELLAEWVRAQAQKEAAQRAANAPAGKVECRV